MTLSCASSSTSPIMYRRNRPRKRHLTCSGIFDSSRHYNWDSLASDRTRAARTCTDLHFCLYSLFAHKRQALWQRYSLYTGAGI